VYLCQSSTKFIPCQTPSPNVISLTGRSPNVYRYFWSLLPCKIFLNKALSIEVKWGIIRFISSGTLGPTNKLSSIIGRPELARSRAILYVTLDPDFPWLRMFFGQWSRPRKVAWDQVGGKINTLLFFFIIFYYFLPFGPTADPGSRPQSTCYSDMGIPAFRTPPCPHSQNPSPSHITLAIWVTVRDRVTGLPKSLGFWEWGDTQNAWMPISLWHRH